MRISCDFGPWEPLRGKYDELNRVYDFKNLAGPGTTTKIEVRCRLTTEEAGATSFVYLVFHPHLLEQTTTVAVVFAPTGEVVKYEILTAKLKKAQGGNVCFLVFDQSDAEKLVSVLMLGKQITLRIMLNMASFEWIKAALNEHDPLPYSEACIAPFIPLQNDPSFKTEYELLKSTLMAGSEATSQDEQLTATTESPRLLAIVMCPPDECGYPVYLMKLDDQGELDFNEGWFELTYKATRDDQLISATRLADKLKLKVVDEK
ncbi:MAG: hypothetical protein WCD52_14605 [Xanthobacteraceae bacterium]